MFIGRRLLKWWKRFGRWMGDQVARVIFSAIYFTVALPFGLAMRLAADPLGKKAAPTWQAKSERAGSLDDARRLF